MRMVGLVAVACMLACAGTAGAGSPEKTEVWDPQPKRVVPAPGATAPSDALVLFNGKDLAEWTMSADPGKPAAWPVAGGVFSVGKGRGHIQTRRVFGDYQLHLEWRTAPNIEGAGQHRGNSGVFLASTGAGHEGYELQILDCDGNKTYANGVAGSIYKQHIPLANACAPRGQWQVYDVLWTAPRFHADGKLASPAYVTVLHNGVLIHNHAPLLGETVYEGAPAYRAHGAAPIKLQDHGEAVSFLNIWIRAL